MTTFCRLSDHCRDFEISREADKHWLVGTRLIGSPGCLTDGGMLLFKQGWRAVCSRADVDAALLELRCSALMMINEATEFSRLFISQPG